MFSPINQRMLGRRGAGDLSAAGTAARQAEAKSKQIVFMCILSSRKGIVSFHHWERSSRHGLGTAKVKTRWWLAELRRRAVESDVFRQALEENLREQGCEAA